MFWVFCVVVVQQGRLLVDTYWVDINTTTFHAESTVTARVSLSPVLGRFALHGTVSLALSSISWFLPLIFNIIGFQFLLRLH